MESTATRTLAGSIDCLLWLCWASGLAISGGAWCVLMSAATEDRVALAVLLLVPLVAGHPFAAWLTLVMLARASEFRGRLSFWLLLLYWAAVVSCMLAVAGDHPALAVASIHSAAALSLLIPLALVGRRWWQRPLRDREPAG